jgi:hypothetical protein
MEFVSFWAGASLLGRGRRTFPHILGVGNVSMISPTMTYNWRDAWGFHAANWTGQIYINVMVWPDL